MWNKNTIRIAFIIATCFLIIGIAVFGNVISSHVATAATASPSHSHVTSSTNSATAFTVTSIDMSISPTTISLWKCGSYIQVTYNAVFHVVSGPNGGTIVFSYTLNNGRSQTPEKLTILPGQRLSNFTFTWQGSLPSDHTYPGLGGVQVTSPNSITSQMVAPADTCR